MEESITKTEHYFSNLGLWLGFGALLSFMVVLTLTGLAHMAATQQKLEHIVGHNMRKVSLAGQMHTAARERTVSLQKMLLLVDPFERDDQFLLFNHFGADFVTARQALSGMALSEQEQVLLSEQGSLSAVAVPLQRRVVELIAADRLQDAHDALVREAVPAQGRVLEKLQALHEHQEQMAAAEVSRAVDAYGRARTWMLLLSGGTLVLGCVIAVTVLRQKRRADRALRQEKERAQVTLHSIGDAMIRTDAQNRIEYLNPVAERLTEWSNEDAHGHHLHEVFRIVHDDTRETASVDPPPDLADDSLNDQSGDLMLVTRNGHEYAIEHSFSPMHPEQGESAGSVIVFRDVTEVRALAREVQYQATHDLMTGLINRFEFERRVQRSLEEVRSTRVEHVLCYIDLDLFKVVNDTCGHAAGDELLKQISALLRARAGGDAVVARIGGDEFGVLFLYQDIDLALSRAEVLRRAVRDFRFGWEDKSFQVGASIGLVNIVPSGGDVNDIMGVADVACRTAKEEGRNRVHVVQSDDIALDEHHKQVDWVQRINRAIAEDEFVLSGQWIYPLQGDRDRAPHCELLLRMVGAAGEIIGPGAFLNAAERYHLMPAVDRWVVARALAELGRLPWHTLKRFGCFHINLSGQSLCDPEFLNFVLTHLEDSGVPPPAVCFEITETAAVANFSSAKALIGVLAAKGCRIALDDFGTGLSSFSYLKNIKVDYLKIDGAFIRNIVDDPTDLAMVNSINQVAHIMNIETVAEYVESEAISAVLTRVGIDYGQGYALARPTPLANVLATLTADSARVASAQG